MTKVYFDARKLLLQFDLQATSRRIDLLNLFGSAKLEKKPLDAQYFIDKLYFDRVTVFRILNLFVEKGLLRKLEFGEGKARYELATAEDHHHLICEQCGKVEDVEDKVIPALEKHIESRHHFKVRKHSLEFFGTCQQCLQGGKN